MKLLPKISLFVLIMLFMTHKLAAQTIKIDGKEFPVPPSNSNQLFYLQRTENINTVVYELNQQNGILNTEKPIHIFWIMYDKNKQNQELSEIEKEFAYGIKIKLADNKQCQFTLVAYPKIKLQILKDNTQNYHVYVTPTKQQMILKHIYIKEKEGALNLKPNIEYIEFSGTDITGKKEITEQIIP